ncbi:helix-turn-helix domain-containing protein [Maribacter sp. R77961]|uniref:helix-turn-helix domain-containing protein n=1 Tax=Maribacter sp. R77961 TaxID=3093871 RepID=UPI0037C6950C
MTAIFNFLMIAGAVQGFVFNIATFASRKKIEKPILYLNLFVLFLSLNNLQSWLIDENLLFEGIKWQNFTLPWYVLIVPMFYAFLLYYLEIEEERFSLVRLSIGLFFLELLTRTVANVMVVSKVWPAHYLSIYNNIEDAITLAFSLFLFYKSINIVFRFKPIETPVLAFDDLKWLKWFFYLGGGVFLLWILSIVFNITGWVAKPYSYYPLRLGSSVLIYWVGYQAFFRYTILKDRVLLRKEIRSKKPKEGRLRDRNSRGQVAFSEVDDYVLSNQKYLDPYLSLEILAEELGKSTSNLSKLMNTYAGQNFSDYINNYRVIEAKKLLANENFETYTIVAIGLECGFNSKSTFYTSFKKFTGLTPTIYRKEAVS